RRRFRIVTWGIPALASLFLIWATYGQLPVIFGISQEALPPSSHPYEFSNGMTLDGMTITQVDTGWWVDLQWNSGRALQRNWSVTVQYYEQENGKITGVSQEDSYPGNGLKPTTAWLPGESVRDRHWIASK